MNNALTRNRRIKKALNDELLKKCVSTFRVDSQVLGLFLSVFPDIGLVVPY